MLPSYAEAVAITTELLRRHVEGRRAIQPTDHIQNDLGLDSLSLMELVADVEGKFDVDIPAAMFDSISTVEDVARAIVTLKAAA